MPRLLVVDDEQSIREMFKILLEEDGYEVDLVSDGKEAISKIESQPYDLVITDLMMPEVGGMEVLKRSKEISPNTLLIMMTAYATAESAVDAMKVGAYDYIMKPFKIDEVRLVIERALEKSRLQRENSEMKSEIGRREGFSHFVGKSPEMLKVFDLISRISSGRSSVLVVGESGTGKELVAKAIHENSPRANKPFVSINCAAIPENLIESELFGYMKGAFTGANVNRMGLFESANQGTFFLDEIGELPSQVQVKLLRVLQERSVRRLGSTTAAPVDVRIISATNRDLEEAVAEGKFREDLYYRLNVIRIPLPALRDRRDDIPLLASHFLSRTAAEQGKQIDGITPEAIRVLSGYGFPGNVRELENIMEQCVALERTKQIGVGSLPDKLRGTSAEISTPDTQVPAEGLELEKAVDTYEKKLLLEALRLSGGVKKHAAELLKISFRSMRYRLLKHGIADRDENE